MILILTLNKIVKTSDLFLCHFHQQKIIMDPASYDEVRSRPTLEEMLESIISGAAHMADSDCTRDDRRERIVTECNAVRQALQDLLSEYMNNVGCLPFYKNCITFCCLSITMIKWKFRYFIEEKN